MTEKLTPLTDSRTYADKMKEACELDVVDTLLQNAVALSAAIHTHPNYDQYFYLMAEGECRNVYMAVEALETALAAFGWSNTVAAFRYLAPLLGVFAFVYGPLMAAMVAEVAGSDLAAAATGLTNAFWQIGSVIVPLVVGAVFGATDSFHAAFATLAIGPGLGAVIMAFVHAD